MVNLVIKFLIKTHKYFETRMHSSRICTVRCSSHLLVGVSAQGDVCAWKRGCLPSLSGGGAV